MSYQTVSRPSSECRYRDRDKWLLYWRKKYRFSETLTIRNMAHTCFVMALGTLIPTSISTLQNLCLDKCLFFSCDQAALWMFFSVRPSVRLSVCHTFLTMFPSSVCPSVTPFWLCSHHRIIMKFSGVITLDQSRVHAKGQGQRSKVKVTTQLFVSGL